VDSCSAVERVSNPENGKAGERSYPRTAVEAGWGALQHRCRREVGRTILGSNEVSHHRTRRRFRLRRFCDRCPCSELLPRLIEWDCSGTFQLKRRTCRSSQRGADLAGTKGETKRTWTKTEAIVAITRLLPKVTVVIGESVFGGWFEGLARSQTPLTR
jgi:hypothetical protein